MNRLMISLSLSLAALAAAARADAAISPDLAICSVRLEPSTAYGLYGGVIVSLDNNYAGCADGSTVQTTYFCSKQATQSNCATSATYHYSELGIQGIYQTAIQAMVNERFVDIFHENSFSNRGQQLRVN